MKKVALLFFNTLSQIINGFGRLGGDTKVGVVSFDIAPKTVLCVGHFFSSQMLEVSWKVPGNWFRGAHGKCMISADT